MKNIILISFLVVALGMPSLAAAQTPPAGNGTQTATPSTAQTSPQGSSDSTLPQPTFVQPETPTMSAPTIDCNTYGGNCTVTTQAADYGSGYVPLAPIPGLTQGATADSGGLAMFFNNLYKYLVGLAAALAVIMIIWGGVEIATVESVSGKSEGKERIQQALLGLVLVLSPVLVFSIINPAILNLSVSIPSLNTTWGTWTDTQGINASVNTRLAANQQWTLCSDKTTCAAQKNLCEKGGGSANLQCFDPKDGNFYDTSWAGSAWYGATFHVFGTADSCAQAYQQMGIVCTGASQPLAGAAQASVGPIINTANITLTSFTDKTTAPSTCPQSGHTGPLQYAGTSYTYALCVRPSVSYTVVISRSLTGVDAGLGRNKGAPDPAQQNTVISYIQDCTNMISALSGGGVSKTPTVTTEYISDPNKPATCSAAAIGKYGADAQCYSSTASCTP